MPMRQTEWFGQMGTADGLAFLSGGEMGARVRAHDWSTTPVGAPGQWPQSLKTAVSICLGSRYPIVIWWDRNDHTQFYNDAYISFLGAAKHPGFLGRSGRDCWKEIWPIIGPMIESVYTTAEATWSEDLLLVLDRNLPREEGYFTFSYSPIRDDIGSIGGIFCACYETTDRVIGERRLKTLRDLSRMEVESSAEGACQAAALTLEQNPGDIPFSLIYLLDDTHRGARLAATTKVQAGDAAAPMSIDLQASLGENSIWPLQVVVDTGTAQVVPDLAERFGCLPGGLWSEPCQAALIVPIAAPGRSGPTGFFVSGLSPRRVFDADYRSFLALVAGHVGTSIANSRAYEEARKRAEALAEIDRAKTLFFSNVSHEFRTPLTLMLGPLRDVLQDVALSGQQRQQLDVAYRNSQRLLKLVNLLLDFSRIETGRTDAFFEPVDLAALTADLASNFRTVCERVGLNLVVDCRSLPEPVYVDRDMWEKIVLNLLSNAFKFTFEGEIVVTVAAIAGQAQLIVRDTGVGVPEHALPRLFDRFYRGENQRSRTYEGSGIGLALVQELVRLHGGTIVAESRLDHGTTFAVSIPLGSAHLQPSRVGTGRSPVSTADRAEAYVNEALGWLSDDLGDGEAPPQIDAVEAEAASSGGGEARILVADDNADMRSYLRRLLGDRYEVTAAADGEAALESIRERRPDLVLADVMMPRADGFGLLRAIRGDPRLRDLPVIFLSARAGEEASSEGLSAGADDYLVKPFSARELLARVDGNLKLARLRRQATADLQESERRLRALAGTLERRVTEEIAAREQAQVRLTQAQRMEALGQLAGGIAHDFNNILQAVQGGAALIERRPGEVERVCGLARRILEAAERGAAVTRRLLAFSRRDDLRAEPVDVASVLAGMEEIFSHTLGAGITVRLETEPDLPLLFADKAQLETVLVNLATNARDAMRDMGTLTLSAATEVVRDRDGVPRPVVLKAGIYVRLCVADTGFGMTPEVLARASEPFFTTKPVGQGTGLGLAMARGFAEQSGGAFSIESTLGRGTAIKLWFPVAERVPAGGAAHGSEAVPGGCPEAHARLLLVDDDEIVRETLAQEMETEGYAVLPTASAAEALALLEAGEAVDLVISDLSMPGMDGLTLIREAQRRRPRLPAILLTGFATTAAAIGVETGGGSALTLIRKPVHGRALAERAAILLEGVAGGRLS